MTKQTIIPSNPLMEVLMHATSGNAAVSRQGITIRRATLADHDVLVAHSKALAWETEGKNPESKQVAEAFHNLLQDPGAIVLVATTAAGEVGGSAWYGCTELSDWLGAYWLWCTGLYVEHMWRRQGVHRAMDEEACRLAQAAGLLGIRTYVAEKNAVSLATHEKLGFVQTGYIVLEKRFD